MAESIQITLIRLMLSGGFYRDFRREGWFNPTSKAFIADEAVAKVKNAADAALLIGNCAVDNG